MAAVVGGRAGSLRSSSAGMSSGYGAPAAALGTSNSSGADARAGVDEDDGQNLWSCILSEVSTRSRSKLPSGKNVVLLGSPQLMTGCSTNIPSYDGPYQDYLLLGFEVLSKASLSVIIFWMLGNGPAFMVVCRVLLSLTMIYIFLLEIRIFFWFPAKTAIACSMDLLNDCDVLLTIILLALQLPYLPNNCHKKTKNWAGSHMTHLMTSLRP